MLVSLAACGGGTTSQTPSTPSTPSTSSTPSTPSTPSVTSGKVELTVDSLGLGSQSRASRAAAYVLDGAASPMEAKLALLLSLPKTRGGYALPAPRLNAPFTLSDKAFALYPHNPCRLDLYWPGARLDVEYDGEEVHTGEQHVRDVARAAALTADRVEVLPLSHGQLADAEAFETVAGFIAKRLGVRLRV